MIGHPSVMSCFSISIKHMDCSHYVTYSVYRAVRLLMALLQVMLLEPLQKRLRRT
jgi:hypothetical protein